MQKVFEQITAHPRYQENLDWGKPRKGHPEGTVRGHIAQLERNLEGLRSRLSEEQYWKLKVLIHVHDSFKAEAKRGVPISDPRSHASLAKDFLAEFCGDADLLNMVQFHDEPFALWRQFDERGTCSQERLKKLRETIQDWDLFLIFLIVDGSTDGKERCVLEWFLGEVAGRVPSNVNASWLERVR